MKRHRFSRGQRFLVGEREFVIEQELNDGVLQLRDIATNTSIQRTVESLLDLFPKSEIKFLSDSQRESYCAQKLGQMRNADLSLLPLEIRAQLDRRNEYVSGVIKKGPIPRTTEAFDPIVKEIGQRIGDPKPPSAIQVYRWTMDYKKSSESIRALIPRIDKKGNRTDRFDPEELSILNSKINEIYMTPQRKGITAVYEGIAAETARQNKLREATDQLRIPSNKTVSNYINKLDRYEVMKARYGKLVADLEFRPMEKRPEVTYPLERVEIDHTKLDLFVVDLERRMPIGRPWLTSAIDVRTRCILGIYIGFIPPSYISVMNCLQNAIVPKGYVEEEFEGINHKWDAHGLMDLLVVDNGKEFWSKHLEDACLQLGIMIQYAPIKLAWFKGTVERHFRTLNTGLLHNQPGTTFSNIFDKGDYDPQKNAVIDLPTLRWAIHKWIIDIYHRKPHKGLMDIPALVWEKGIETHPPALPSSVLELQVLIGMMAERTITKSGIEFKGLFYNDENLNKFRRKAGAADKVIIKYHDDLSVIYVADMLKRTYFPVRAVDHKYTRGLTIWQHDVIRRYAKQNIKENYDMTDLCIAKAEIQERVEAAWKKTGKHETRSKMARWIGQPLEGHGTIEGKSQQRADTVDSLLKQTEENEIVMPEVESNPANGISSIGQVITCSDESLVKAQIGTKGAEEIMTPEMIKQKKQEKADKREKGGQLGKAKNKTVKEGVKKETVIQVSTKSQKTGEKEESSDLDLSGWDVGYLER